MKAMPYGLWPTREPRDWANRAVRMASDSELTNVLLDLIAPGRAITTNYAHLAAADWNYIEARAREHRVLPLLHWASSQSGLAASLPTTFKSSALQAFKESTLRALQMQRELLSVGDRLREAGVAYLALKGAYLAFAVYPQAGLRPLRDLDLLVPREQALVAYRTLTHAGFTAIDRSMGDAAEWMQVNKHLPRLRSPTHRVILELHVRISSPSANGTIDDEGLWSRRITRDVMNKKVSYLCATDLLLHLISHAAYQHRFDNGPLILSDIAFLLSRDRIEWPLFWRMARQRHWSHGALLMLEMTQRYWDHLPVEYGPVPSAARAAAREMADNCAAIMVQEFKRRGNLQLAAQLAKKSVPQKFAVLARKVFPRREFLAIEHPAKAGGLPLLRSRGRHFAHRMRTQWPEVLAAYRHSSVRSNIRKVSALVRWLESP